METKTSFLQLFEKLEGFVGKLPGVPAKTDPAGNHPVEGPVSAAACAAPRADRRSGGRFGRACSTRSSPRRSRRSRRTAAADATPPAVGLAGFFARGPRRAAVARCPAAVGVRRSAGGRAQAALTTEPPDLFLFLRRSPGASVADDASRRSRPPRTPARPHRTRPPDSSVRAGHRRRFRTKTRHRVERDGGRPRAAPDRAGRPPEDRAAPGAGDRRGDVHAVPARRHVRPRERPPPAHRRDWSMCSSPNCPTRPGWKWRGSPARGRRRPRSRKPSSNPSAPSAARSARSRSRWPTCRSCSTFQLAMVAGIIYISGRELSLKLATEFLGTMGINVGFGLALARGCAGRGPGRRQVAPARRGQRDQRIRRGQRHVRHRARGVGVLHRGGRNSPRRVRLLKRSQRPDQGIFHLLDRRKKSPRAGRTRGQMIRVKLSAIRAALANCTSPRRRRSARISCTTRTSRAGSSRNSTPVRAMNWSRSAPAWARSPVRRWKPARA